MKFRITAALVAFCSVGLHAQEVDSKLPAYTPQGSLAGSIKSVGSDTMNLLMTLWAQEFSKLYPAVKAEIQAPGSGAGASALIDGTCNFAPMSREFKKEEIDRFNKKYGYEPTQVRVAVDMIAVFVNKDNPVKQMSLAQLDAVFSSTLRQGEKKALQQWNELEASLPPNKFSVYGRNAQSGTYAFFKERVLKNGDYRPTVKEMVGGSGVVQAVAKDKAGIGFAGIGTRTPDVRPVPLVNEEGETADATPENAYSGKYPLARFLYIYINRRPGEKLDPMRREFFNFHPEQARSSGCCQGTISSTYS